MNYSTAVLLFGIPIMAAALLLPFAWLRDHPGTFKDKRLAAAAGVALAFLALAVIHYYLRKSEEPPHDPYLKTFGAPSEEPLPPGYQPPPAPPPPQQRSR